MGKEFFDDEAQQHAADLDIVREIRHNDASLYQLAHGRGARWQFDQLKSQLEEKDARIAELEKQIELSKPIYSRRQLEAQLEKAEAKMIEMDNTLKSMAMENIDANMALIEAERVIMELSNCMHPHKTEHPAMFAAKTRAREYFAEKEKK